MIAREIGSRALIVSLPPMLAYQGIRVLGWILGDVVNTRDEVRGLMQERLYVELAAARRDQAQRLGAGVLPRDGRRYTSELQRRLDRMSGHHSK